MDTKSLHEKGTYTYIFMNIATTRPIGENSCYPYFFGNSNDHKHPSYIAWERKEHNNKRFKGANKEFRWFKVAYK